MSNNTNSLVFSNIVIGIVMLCLGGILGSAYASETTCGKATGNTTVYKASINGSTVICNIVEHTKLGYNMSNCFNGNSYFNVTNIEMTRK
jgi:hypothetical protein